MAYLMITMKGIYVILSIPVSPVYINALVLFNSKSLPTFVNHTITWDCYTSVLAYLYENYGP